MSFQDVRPGQGRRAMSSSSRGDNSTYNGGNANSMGASRTITQSSRMGVASQGTRTGGGFGSMGPLRTGGIGVSGPAPGSSQNGGSAGFGPSGRHIPPAVSGRMSGSSGGAKVGDYLMSFSQNVSMLHGMVQQLGSSRDTAELRGQCRCQMEVIDELREKIKTELSLLQQQAAGASRLEAARLGAMNSKLTKDFNRVNAIALDLGRQAERRMVEVETERRRQVEEDEQRAREAFQGVGVGFGGGRQQTGMMEAQQQRRQRFQAEEEAINTAIIQETEEELQQINRSLYKVNEIYRELATIVDQQQEAVDMIESNTEGAHARAQEGLVQVQKANEYQPGCTVS